MKLWLKNWLFKNNSDSNYFIFITLGRKAKGLLVYCIIISQVLIAQINLVPNPSFESYTTCPASSGALNNAIPWYNPTTTGTPDLFNACSSVVSVPYCNGSGSCYQNAHSGNGFIGIWCFRNSLSNLREYAEVQMIDSLTTGKCYFVSFNFNLVNWAGYGSNNLACNISKVPVTSAGSSYLINLSPSIKKFKNEVITDTLNWLTISGVFMASGGENYLTIGNFNTDSTTDTVKTNISAIADGAYYFIDDVSVSSIDSIPGGMPAFAGNDTSVAIGDSVFIGQEISNLNCNWYNASGALIAGNASGIFVSPAGSTHYVVEQDLCGTITYDTVNVNVSGVGIHENEWDKNIALYPNPNPGEFTLEFSSEAQWLIELRDIQGRILLKESTGNRVLKLKPDAENGVYLVQITNVATNESVVKKLVIQK